MISLKQHKKK